MKQKYLLDTANGVRMNYIKHAMLNTVNVIVTYSVSTLMIAVKM